MLNFGIRPDEFSYPSVLMACGEQLDLGFGKEVHNSILVSNYGESICVRNALISMYGKCGEVGVARVLFDNLPNKDGYSWNSMISRYASKGMWEEAFVLFEKMRLEDVELNIITWNTIIGRCLRTGNYDRALDLVYQMRTCAIMLDVVSMASGLCACSHMRSIKTGKEMHAFIIHGGCANFLNVENALITMYAWYQDHRHSHIIFQQMEEKDIISWNSIISGYAHYGKYEEASFLFREMLLCGFRPNYVTIASILPLCAREANLQHGKELHCFIIKRQDFSEYLLLWNARGGYGEVALKLFEETNNSGIKPDLISLVAILSACIHSGLVIQAGLLKKAEEIIKTMPFEPSADMWATLIRACQIHRNIDLGEWAAEKLLALRPRNPGFYVLIANMYTTASCWDKLARVRTYMRDLGLLKSPGCAWVDLGSGFEPFSWNYHMRYIPYWKD
uniref:Pentatricopeptide repeat-containing protein n=1 Tax=Chenopodium quinoa TaxID=63459 RepID=A0A803MXK5_CHEQI